MILIFTSLMHIPYTYNRNKTKICMHELLYYLVFYSDKVYRHNNMYVLCNYFLFFSEMLLALKHFRLKEFFF